MQFDHQHLRRMHLLSAAFGLVFAAALTGCGKKADAPAPAPATAAAPAPTPAPAPEPAAPPAASADAASTTASAAGSGAGSGSPTGTSIASAASSPSDAANVAAARAAPPVQPTAGTSATPGGSAEAGQSIFASTCVACHGAGVAGAPKLGDKADWGPRIAQGRNALYQHALGGYTGKKGVMPPKGGNTSLADADVRSAVDYMVSQVR